MKCSKCTNHFKAENKDQTICPTCIAEGVKVDTVQTTPESQPLEEVVEQTPDTPEVPVVEEPTVVCEPSVFPYQVRIDEEMVYCHQGPTSQKPVIGIVHKDQVQTIYSEHDGIGASKWGELASGLGWIALDKCSRCTLK